MPRYRYIKAEFNIPAIERTWVQVPRIEVGLRVLEAVGNGKLSLTGRVVKTSRFRISPQGRKNQRRFRKEIRTDEISS